MIKNSDPTWRGRSITILNFYTLQMVNWKEKSVGFMYSTAIWLQFGNPDITTRNTLQTYNAQQFENKSSENETNIFISFQIQPYLFCSSLRRLTLCFNLPILKIKV